MKSLLLLLLPPLVIANPYPKHGKKPFYSSREQASDNAESRLDKRLTRYVDDGNLMCFTENYPVEQGDDQFFMTLDEATKAVNAACSAWQIGELNPGANPGFTNTLYIMDEKSDTTPNNMTVSVTYNGGKDCPSPALNFWYDRNLPGDGSTYCLDRLFTIVNSCIFFLPIFDFYLHQVL